MAGAVGIKVKKTGRLKKPTLDHGALTAIGQEMVAEQKKRWSQGINADGMKAKPLSKPYLYKKAKIRRTNRPIRDLNLTGLLLQNFTLRKAINGVIRAEATSRAARKHAVSAQQGDQMIGFSGSDVKEVYEGVAKRYGVLAQKLWVPIG